MKGEKGLCACGCGATFDKYDDRGRPRRFIHGHNTKGMKFPDQTRSPEWRAMMSDGRRQGSNSPSWKGGRKVEHGYVLIMNPGHPYADSHGYVREHRLIMEQHLRRYLEPVEVVHHINGDPGDNRLENLKLYSDNGVHLSEELVGRKRAGPRGAMEPRVII